LFGASASEGGAAGSRTLVQTSSKNAFYMFILLLIVGKAQEEGTPILTLSFKISSNHQGSGLTSPAFLILRTGHRRAEFPGKQLVT